MSSNTMDALDLLPPITGTQSKRGQRSRSHTKQVSTRSARGVKPTEPVILDEETGNEPISTEKGWRSYLRMPFLGRSSYGNANSQVTTTDGVNSSTSSATTVATNTIGSITSPGAVPTQPSGTTRSVSASSFVRRSLSVALGSPCLWWQHEEDKNMIKNDAATKMISVNDIISPTKGLKTLSDNRIERQLAFDDDEVLKSASTVTTRTTSKSTKKSVTTTQSNRKRERSNESALHVSATITDSNTTSEDFESMPFWDLVERCKQANLKLPTRPKKIDCIKQLKKAAKIALEEIAATQATVEISSNKRSRSISMTSTSPQRNTSALGIKGKSVEVSEETLTPTPRNYDNMTAKILRDLVKKRGVYTTDMTTKAKMITALMNADCVQLERSPKRPRTASSRMSEDTSPKLQEVILPSKTTKKTIAKSKASRSK